jgi:hypothetical protein
MPDTVSEMLLEFILSRLQLLEVTRIRILIVHEGLTSPTLRASSLNSACAGIPEYVSLASVVFI